MTTLLPSPCPVLGWEMTDFEKVLKEESSVQGQAEVPAQPHVPLLPGSAPWPGAWTWRGCSSSQLPLGRDRAAPPAGTGNTPGMQHRPPFPTGAASFHGQGRANTTRELRKDKTSFYLWPGLCRECSELAGKSSPQFMNELRELLSKCMCCQV